MVSAVCLCELCAIWSLCAWYVVCVHVRCVHCGVCVFYSVCFLDVCA